MVRRGEPSFAPALSWLVFAACRLKLPGNG
jgi:hypothetical protein